MTLRDPGSWLIKTVISLVALSIPVIAVAQGGALRLFESSWGGLTVYFAMLLGIKPAADISKKAVDVQMAKITGVAPVPEGDPEKVAE